MNFINNKNKLIWTIIILLLIFGNIFFAINYFNRLRQLEILQKEVSVQRTNVKVVNFLDLFIKKVLKTNKEISFEDRLKLENAVRDINDPEILTKWEQFTGGVNENQIQQRVKDLLEILVKKIAY